MGDLDALARLTARIEKLESRISALEQPFEKAAFVSDEPATPVALRPTAQAFSFAKEGMEFAVLGKAMLGIAGAYLLRAVAESGSVPKLAVVVLALVYTGTWLVWAARVPAAARFASTVYATSAAFILAPMLWELTLRFEVLPSSATAGVLGMFVVFAYALAWKRKLTPVVWVTNVTAVFTSLALLIATHDVLSFLAALLVMSLASEVAAARNYWLGLRPLVAVAADLAACLLLYVYSRPAGIPPGYEYVKPQLLIGCGCLLLLIYGGSIVFRTMRLRQRINVFEIGQTSVAFLLAALSVRCFSGSAGDAALGVFCLLFSAACYAAAYKYFDRFDDQRNYHVYANWGAALFLTASFLCLSPLPLSLLLSMAAIVATLLGVRASRLTPEFHGLACLAAAAYASGLLDYAGRSMMGTFPVAPTWIVWIVAVATIVCYAVIGRVRTELWNQRLLQLLSAILAADTVITFLVSFLVWSAALGMTTGVSQVAVIRTFVSCILALVLAFSRSRWQRSELVWIAYGILVLVAAKLFFEDLQHGNSGYTAVSIFLYAVALIFVPRLARVRHRPVGDCFTAAGTSAASE